MPKAKTSTESCFCEKCKKTMRALNFYTSNNLEKYPNGGKMNMCKECLTMHVDNWNPDTFLWILQELDVPWIPDEWNKLMSTYAKDPSSVTGMTIIGRYLSKMKLKQHKEFRWKDNQFLQDLANSKIEQTMRTQGYDAAEIAQVINNNTFDFAGAATTMPANMIDPDSNAFSSSSSGIVAPEIEDYFAQISGADKDNFDDDLTDEEKVRLRLKWGKTYKPEEWIRLEQLFEEMMESYDIQTAGHVDTLKLICKTSLKANQLIDIGD